MATLHPPCRQPTPQAGWRVRRPGRKTPWRSTAHAGGTHLLIINYTVVHLAVSLQRDRWLLFTLTPPARLCCLPTKSHPAPCPHRWGHRPATGSRRHCSTLLCIVNCTGGPLGAAVAAPGHDPPCPSLGCHTRDRHRALGKGGQGADAVTVGRLHGPANCGPHHWPPHAARWSSCGPCASSALDWVCCHALHQPWDRVIAQSRT